MGLRRTVFHCLFAPVSIHTHTPHSQNHTLQTPTFSSRFTFASRASPPPPMMASYEGLRKLTVGDKPVVIKCKSSFLLISVHSPISPTQRVYRSRNTYLTRTSIAKLNVQEQTYECPSARSRRTTNFALWSSASFARSFRKTWTT